MPVTVRQADTEYWADAAALVFEYLALTQAETGRPRPSGIDELPQVLRHECRHLHHVYRSPGALLLAYQGGQPVGCVGIAAVSPDSAEIKRLYVRETHRGHRIARSLMDHAHRHAARHRFTQTVLDVLPARTTAIGFYRRLGYTDAPPYAGSPVPMIYFRRRLP
ncbi:MAG TPA: GNAT family N-acetyltransferase [Pseudonocardiaceae bacterium]|nr:GNAT family N-acetyltransferase [Pseudonocardiaceae bacterium]